ncbi:MAG: HAD-IA family hydrolase [Gammaproteobacteria bacterium]|nr:HAD-IA family hydrolase [Gammaproteobacteria bacterium]
MASDAAGPVRCRALLFDLDGTLADTAPDLAGALNALLAELGRPPLPYAAIRPHVSHGARALIRLGLDLGDGDPEFAPLHLRFLEIYRGAIAVETRLFDGMEALLATAEARGIPWGVVTNKPARLTDPLMEALGLTARAGCIVSGDTTAHAKPHPEPMFHASREVGVPPESCLFVGDAERDIEAARRAGMRSLVARFGYIGPDDRPETWGADGQVDSPAEIAAWIA